MDVGFPPPLSSSIRWGDEGKKGDFALHLSVSIGWGKEGGRRIQPTSLHQYQMGERRLIGGFLPHLSIRIKCREKRFKGDFPPYIFFSILWVKDGLWGIRPTCLCQYPMVGKNVDGGIPPYFQNKMEELRLIGFPPHLWIRIRWGGKKGNSPQIYMSVLYGEKECVIAVSLREIAIIRDFLHNPPSWRAYFVSNPPVSLAENLTVFGR